MQTVALLIIWELLAFERANSYISPQLSILFQSTLLEKLVSLLSIEKGTDRALANDGLMEYALLTDNTEFLISHLLMKGVKGGTAEHRFACVKLTTDIYQQVFEHNQNKGNGQKAWNQKTGAELKPQVDNLLQLAKNDKTQTVRGEATSALKKLARLHKDYLDQKGAQFLLDFKV